MNLPEKSALCPYLAPKPSHSLALFLLAAPALAFVAAWANLLELWLKLLLSVSVALSLWHVLKERANSHEIAGLQLKPDGSWMLRLSSGDDIEAKILGSSIANPWFVLLHLQTENKRYSMLIPRDSLEPDDFRRLRVALIVVGVADVKNPASQ